MEQFEKKYKRLRLKKKVFIFIFFGLMALAFLTGLTGIIVCGVQNNETMITFFAVLGLGLPIVMWVAFLIASVARKDKAKEKLDLELMESNLSADEIMKIGDKYHFDLYGVASVKRAKELGIDHLPEGCLRDRVLPTKEDLLENELLKARKIENILKRRNGSGKNSYNVDYHGQKDMFTGAENSYREGETVELSYGLIATDTDYSFIVDGQVVKANWNEKKGYIIKFTMPDHDIDVYCTQSNSMIKR